MSTKTDNGNVISKLALRKHFIERYPPRKVLDCCAGEQVMWKQLRKHFDVEYLGLDKKDIPGTLKADSIDYLRRGNGAEFDVVDIDTYGSPFRHLAALSQFLRQSTTVFVTFGATGVGKIQGEALYALGIDFALPMALATQLAEESLNEVLGGIIAPHKCEYARESPPNNLSGGRPTRYIGMRINP